MKQIVPRPDHRSTCRQGECPPRFVGATFDVAPLGGLTAGKAKMLTDARVPETANSQRL